MIRTSDRKGTDVTLEMARKDPVWEYIIACGRVREWGRNAPENVRFVGWHDDRREFFSLADIVVVPSRWEALGRVPIEALRYGKGVLVADRGGLPEAVGWTPELIVGSHAAEDWLERLAWIDAFREKGFAAVRRARSLTDRFQPDVQFERFEQYLRHVADGTKDVLSEVG